MLDLSSLRKSVDALERSVRAADSVSEETNPDIREAIRAGVIQHFEVAYEQCWKQIRRWLRENAVPDETERSRARKELFRMAARYGLVTEPQAWFEYGDARNLTSHVYSEEQATIVYETARRFLPDAQALLREMESRND